MDEDYARKLRNWLRAEPEATPREASEERQWLRELPEPAADEQADRWTVSGQLPQTPADDAWVCPVITLPVPRSSRENGCRISGIELRWSPPAAGTAPTSHPTGAETGRSPSANADGMSDAEARSRWNHPTNVNRRTGAAGPRHAADLDRRNGAEPGHAANPDRRTEATGPSHAANPDPRTPDPAPMTEAEARSRWNHPTNWHRRRRAADDRRDLGGR
ncbi:hypothetical protein [Amycolatopsis rifamycinica]|uniref:Uncharacterized protein n=1 Tax=Amycolatopsis rifamycinica TaxID=287986 RepID=A0A066TTT3_9PSEU|nr:hypothetical protein [Amycolatopsis rifamycinica]KDN18250.1 hypothetical protein DV20_30875 [Amycolatopsis rifamycinica]